MKPITAGFLSILAGGIAADAGFTGVAVSLWIVGLILAILGTFLFFSKTR